MGGVRMEGGIGRVRKDRVVVGYDWSGGKNRIGMGWGQEGWGQEGWGGLGWGWAGRALGSVG